MGEFCDATADGAVVLRVHAQPGAHRSAVSGRFGEAVKIKVAAPPRDGRANAALVGFVADLLGVRASAVTLVAGESSRTKRLRVEGRTEAEVDAVLRRVLAPGDGA